MFLISLLYRYYSKTTRFKGLGILPFKIQDACEDFKVRCPTLYACLEAVTKTGTNPNRLYASAMILLNARNSRINAFQKLTSMLLWKGQLKAKVRMHGKGRVRMLGFMKKSYIQLCTIFTWEYNIFNTQKLSCIDLT